MARLRQVVRYQWRAYWRTLKGQGGWRSANLAFMLVVGGMFLILHTFMCLGAAAMLRAGETTIGTVVAELAFMNILAGWLFLPILVAGVQPRGAGVTPARLLQYPLSRNELFLVGIAAALMQPVYWLLALASLVTLIPVFQAAAPVPGFVAALLLLLVAALLSWALGLAGEAVFASRRWRSVATVCLVLAYFGVLFGSDFVDFERTDEGFFLGAGEWRVMLLDGDGGGGLFSLIRDLTPSAWVMAAASGNRPALWIGMLAVVALASAWVGRASLWRLLRTPPVARGGNGSGKAIGPLPWLRGPVAVAARKELRYHARTLDQLMGTVLALGLAGYLFLAEDPPRAFFLMGIAFIPGMQQALLFNAFGLDRDGVDRYRLMPLTGAEVLASKHAANISVLCLQAAPVWLAISWRLGPARGLAAAFGMLACLLFLAVHGGRISIGSPCPRDFFELARNEQQGGFTAGLMVLGTLVAAMIIYRLSSMLGTWAIPLAQLGLLVAAIAYYRRQLPDLGTRFDRAAELMRRKLSG